MDNANPTIVAVSTPPGRGGIGIVRLSGPASIQISEAICARSPQPGRVVHTAFRDRQGNALDDGLVLAFTAPASFTGEDVVEFHGHGSPVVLSSLVAECVGLGAELSRPGEFSERAFLNGRMDLTQAEAVADLIHSTTRAAARAAVRSLQGEFSDKVSALANAVTQLRVFVEAAIDFPEEEIDFLAREDTLGKLNEIEQAFSSLRAGISQGRILRDGLTVVLTGLPNAGKSSLLNVLGGEDRAIVSDIPGTTRDLLHQDIELDGLPLRIVDSAGIREGENEIEAEGVRRAREAQRSADLVLLIIDHSGTGEQQLEVQGAPDLEIPMLQVRNKIDLVDGETHDAEDVVHVSALTGAGIDRLRQRLKDFAGYREGGEDTFIARERHLDALNRAEEFFNRGLDQYRTHRAGELLADDLTGCQRALGEITGEVTSEDLLGYIFSSFCIGK